MPKPVTPERMQQIFESVKSWGRWGAQDQAGALNLITGEKRVRNYTINVVTSK